MVPGAAPWPPPRPLFSVTVLRGIAGSGRDRRQVPSSFSASFASLGNGGFLKPFSCQSLGGEESREWDCHWELRLGVLSIDDLGEKTLWI